MGDARQSNDARQATLPQTLSAHEFNRGYFLGLLENHQDNTTRQFQGGLQSITDRLGVLEDLLYARTSPLSQAVLHCRDREGPTYLLGSECTDTSVARSFLISDGDPMERPRFCNSPNSEMWLQDAARGRYFQMPTNQPSGRGLATGHGLRSHAQGQPLAKKPKRLEGRLGPINTEHPNKRNVSEPDMNNTTGAQLNSNTSAKARNDADDQDKHKTTRHPQDEKPAMSERIEQRDQEALRDVRG